MRKLVPIFFMLALFSVKEAKAESYLEFDFGASAMQWSNSSRVLWGGGFRARYIRLTSLGVGPMVLVESEWQSPVGGLGAVIRAGDPFFAQLHGYGRIDIVMPDLVIGGTFGGYIDDVSIQFSIDYRLLGGLLRFGPYIGIAL